VQWQDEVLARGIDELPAAELDPQPQHPCDRSGPQLLDGMARVGRAEAPYEHHRPGSDPEKDRLADGGQ
jgi:hypothetical protein